MTDEPCPCGCPCCADPGVDDGLDGEEELFTYALAVAEKHFACPVCESQPEEQCVQRRPFAPYEYVSPIHEKRLRAVFAAYRHDLWVERRREDAATDQREGAYLARWAQLARGSSGT